MSSNITILFQFLADCTIADGVGGINFTMSKEGRPSGEAFIILETEEDLKKAVEKDRKYMGHRYIEGKAESTPTSE